MLCLEWQICPHWHSQLVNRNTFTSLMAREQKVDRNCFRSSGKAGVSCSPDKSIQSTQSTTVLLRRLVKSSDDILQEENRALLLVFSLPQICGADQQGVFETADMLFFADSSL